MKSPRTLLLALGLSLASLVSPSSQAQSSYFPLPMSDEGLPGTGPIRRAEWFQRLWSERRTGFAASASKEQGALVLLGDSITQGWWDAGSLFPGLKLANRGISGDTTRGVLLRLQEDVLALKPRGVVLLIGTNDLEDNATPEVIAGNLRLILSSLQQHSPEMPVVLLSVLPSSATMRRPADAIRRLNGLYRSVAESFAQVTWVDTWALFADVQGNAKLEDMPDLLHPNGVGYAKLAGALRPVLENLDLAPAWPDDFTPEPGFRSLFNGRDLSGWHYEKEADLGLRSSTADQRFQARNQRLVVAFSRKERDYRQLWTLAEFERDFVLKLEFRASPNADSGVYLRGSQLQCRDFYVTGPFSTVRGYRPQEWNELVITVQGRLAHATCNGEVLVDAMEIPEKGPIGLESDRGQVEYRRIRIQEAR